ncbi:LysE family translocator [Rhodanobacter sp. DHG33]|uniref:LysE family translocator n=1 Tax=Rhodanobacter sp. DHG33 TaxID=2775921 RepID=UPI00178112E7|nr:LysE family translocator [Rhodanobacter sp. DHG33]MBD8900545.1 LysE family translocator [Rhodanobacter sp. DHG33]
MNHPAQLWLFLVVVFGVIALPGLDMAFVFGSALSGGRTRGLAAVGGIVAGGACHVLMAALGISVLVRLVPGVFNALLLAGALYIAWIGILLLRSAVGFHAPATGQAVAPLGATFRQGLFTCLLNPKAYLFMLAIFPQFLHPSEGSLWLQALVLWAIIALTQCGVYGPLALLASRVRGWLQNRPASGVLATRCVGGLLIAVAVFTGLEGLRSA